MTVHSHLARSSIYPPATLSIFPIWLMFAGCACVGPGDPTTGVSTSSAGGSAGSSSIGSTASSGAATSSTTSTTSSTTGSSGALLCTTAAAVVADRGNAGAILEGCRLGAQWVPADDSTTREIPLVVPNPSPQIAISRAYIHQISVRSRFIDLMMEGANISNTTLCEIRYLAPRFLDADGGQVGVVDQIFVRGSMGEYTTFTTARDLSCLAPGEHAWFSSIDEMFDTDGGVLFGRVATLELDTPSTVDGTILPVRAKPTSYSYSDGGVLIEIANTSAQTVDLGYVTAVLLSSQDTALTWTIFPATGTSIPANSSVSLLHRSLFMADSASGTRLYVVVQNTVN